MCREREVAVQTIKGVARGPWGSKDAVRRDLVRAAARPGEVDLAVHWMLGEPGVFLNSPGDLELLPRSSMRPNGRDRPDETEMQSSLANSASAPSSSDASLRRGIEALSFRVRRE